MKQFDTVIAGGGPAGAACAIGLARYGLRPMLITRSPKRSRFCEILPPQAVEDLCARIVFPPLDGSSAVVCSGISVLDAEGNERFQPYTPYTESGLTVNKCAFVSGLLEMAAKTGVEISFEAELKARPNCSNWDCVVCKNGEGEHLRAEFVVESAGRRPANGLIPPIPRVYFDRTVAAFQCFERVLSQSSALSLHSAPASWIYTTAMPAGGTLVVVITDADLISDAGCRERFLDDQLAVLGTDKFNQSEARSQWTILDARTSCRKILWRSRWLPIGDSAFALSPLSGHGIHRAVRHGLAAAEAIHQALRRHSFSKLEELALKTIDYFNREAGKSIKAHSLLSPAPPRSLFWKRRVEQLS